jgi:NAD-dependent DNA ligase
MKDFIEKASACYYSGAPIISDEEFDALVKKYNYDQVGHQVTDGVPHMFRMYSLQKYFNLAEVSVNLFDYVVSPKLDGAAVSLLYVNGHFALGLTRGDGNLGRDITTKLEELVPATIPMKGEVQITGEIVLPSSVTNARNVAAGSLNLKDIQEFRARARDLVFVAYDIQFENDYSNYTDAMNALAHEGFNVVTTFDASNYPTDGLVYRLNKQKDFQKMGHTAHHPRGAFALKEQKEGVHTELLDVVWQVGKSGVVSPVAILSPVEVEGAIVSRATLHNIEYIRSLELEIGCTVEVIRSGDIIPRIVGRVDLPKNSS